MAKRKKKLAKRAEKEAIIAQKEYEDANGIRRAVQSGYTDGLSLKTINIMRVFLLACMPLSYFLYSVLLLPTVFLYGLLYFPVKKNQTNANYGLRKDLHISMPKFDTLIALILVVSVFCVLGLSAITNGTKDSVFAGKNEAQIYAILKAQGMDESRAVSMAARMADSSATLTAAEKFFIQTGTMLTGQRELFATKNAELLGMDHSIRKQRTVSTGDSNRTFVHPPSHGNMSGVSGMARRSGFGGGGFGGANAMSMITNVFGSINLVLLIIIFGGGLVVCITTSKQKRRAL